MWTFSLSTSWIASWNNKAPHRMLLTWWKTGSDQGEDISGKLSKKKKRENPRCFFLHSQPQVYFITMYSKLTAWKKWNANKRFSLVLFSWSSTGPACKALFGWSPSGYFLFRPPYSALSPSPVTAHPTPPSTCLKISWLVASHRGSRKLWLLSIAQCIDLSAIKNKATWITCMPSFVSMYQL